MKPGDPNTRRDGEEPQAPSKLVAALKELPARRVFVPPTVDESVLRAARRHLEPPPRSQFGWLRSWLPWPALAAVCLIVIGLVYFKSGRSKAELAREDLNHDGQVDILDAFQLARDSRSGSDLNGDGVVDGRDADMIAAKAVRLDKGGKS